MSLFKEIKSKINKKVIVIGVSILVVLSSAIIYSVANFYKTDPKSKTEQPAAPETQENQPVNQNPEEDEKKEESKSSENNETSKKSENEVAPANTTISPSKDYSNLYPNLYVKRPEKQISPDKTIFLTFDDGPSQRTAEILDILKQNNIKATFFVIGNTSAEAKNLMKRIVDEGHTIAPHTYTHNFRQIYSSVEAYLDDFNKIYNLIYENTGVKPSIFRFAGGSKNGFNKNNYREIIAEMTRRGFDYFDWNLSVGDAVQKTPTPAVTCISNVTKSSAGYNTAVVLMHDAAPKTTTVEALPGLIKELKAQGFTFDKLSNRIYPAKHSLIKPYA